MNIFLILFGLIKSFIYYFKTHLINELAYHEFLLINNIFIIIFVLLISSYYYYYKKETYENLKNLDMNKYIIIALLAFLTIFSSYVLSTFDFNNIGLIIKLFSNIIIMGLIFLVFNKTLTKSQIIGIIFCSIGIYLTN